MPKSRINSEYPNTPNLFFEESKISLKQGDRVILSLLAVVGLVGLLYLVQCKAFHGDHSASKCLMWKKDLSQADAMTITQPNNDLASSN